MLVLFTTDLPHPYNKIGDGPEGPETARMADSLKKRLEGKILVNIRLAEKVRQTGLDKIVLPLKIEKVTSHGKKIFFYLEDGSIIANEPRMSGYWSQTPAKHVRFTFITNDTQEFHFIASRGLGTTVVLFDCVQKEVYFAKLGPDLLRDKTITKTLWTTRFRKMTIKRKGSRPFLICDALLEQKIFSGIGNYLRADIMYMSRIKPDIPTQELTDEEYERLYTATIYLLQKSYTSKGLTIQNYQDMDGSEGILMHIFEKVRQKLIYDFR